MLADTLNGADGVDACPAIPQPRCNALMLVHLGGGRPPCTVVPLCLQREVCKATGTAARLPFSSLGGRLVAGDADRALRLRSLQAFQAPHEAC